MTDTYSDKETQERADAALKRMLQAAPKPHSDMKKGTRQRRAPKA